MEWSVLAVTAVVSSLTQYCLHAIWLAVFTHLSQSLFFWPFVLETLCSVVPSVLDYRHWMVWQLSAKLVMFTSCPYFSKCPSSSIITTLCPYMSLLLFSTSSQTSRNFVISFRLLVLRYFSPLGKAAAIAVLVITDNNNNYY